ncbi:MULTISPECIES: YebC/PmpR family DNA-binding transcriptional regulator [unclassified Marinobacterium]|jgi:YebC/PmpR family DNA-binding regulatory protein|uniref:YebC/PmpR family DNA-binding transcriptional regulator n=1 Tax=unclassified Marinobacterium TaxID=2644139 RepID=UPI0015688666|nr:MULTISPECIES: YebC/PmpR family DNA-binding transcriptional regulator [unclassified Marinobacterium]NRP26934.1 putative transcriptional regulatory protein YeeN [Marinobacterium sp. xm-d-420]NRP39457.1 putative transcriptional regulatory protein YeeN [Marinobacterium sp. xm-a-121]NRP52021.1 putative transcriptional regulatory protein YeeN [Marinobacterium sp. xm-v-242]NRP57074.1 putative transcriptional regulatory protein YeeN [Marinobacterium sp. xm-d-510]NRP60155.1 putative transcriptional 
MGRAYQNRKASIAKTSDQNAKVYSRYSREIYMSAKSGGSDPNANLSLRSLLDRAKKDQVPAHVIDKAIDKAQGGGGEDFAPARYEGYGPGGSMAIIECLTDNPNRTFGDVRQAFTKTKCKIGNQGAVAHMFEHAAVFVFKHDDEDAVLEALMEADVDVTDLENEEGLLTAFVAPTDYFKAKTALTEMGITDLEVEEIQWVPNSYTEISEEDQVLFDKFLGMLEDLDDVQHVYHNVQL